MGLIKDIVSSLLSRLGKLVARERNLLIIFVAVANPPQDELVQSGVGSVNNSFTRGSSTGAGRDQQDLSHGSAASGRAVSVSISEGPRTAFTPTVASAAGRGSGCCRPGSVDVLNLQLSEVAVLPAALGRTSSGGRRGGNGGGSGGIASACNSGAAGCGGCGSTGSGIVSGSRVSDLLLSRLTWSASLNGSAGGGGGNSSHDSAGSSGSAVVCSVSTASAGSSATATSQSPSVIMRQTSFMRTSTSYGNQYGGALYGDIDARFIADLTDDGVVTPTSAAAATITSPAATTSVARHSLQSSRRSSQLLIQAAGRRSSTVMPSGLVPTPPLTPPPLPSHANVAAAAGASISELAQTRVSRGGLAPTGIAA